MKTKFELSEQDYRYLFENASDAMWVHDMEGNILEKQFVPLQGSKTGAALEGDDGFRQHQPDDGQYSEECWHSEGKPKPKQLEIFLR